MDLLALHELLARMAVLAKEIGKGGGGSTEEPTVCIALLPIAVGVGAVIVQRLRRILWVPGGRTAAPVSSPERKVQTA